MHGRNYPTQIGNVVYLSGEPPQSSLEAIFEQAIGDIDLDAAIERFSTALLHAGRPGQRVNITTNLGPRIIDLILSGHSVSRVPWHNCWWFKQQFFEMPMFEVSGSWEGEGWYAQLRENILLHVPFSGVSGLGGFETACILSESPEPDSKLVTWLDELLADEDLDVDFTDIYSHVPTDLIDHLGFNFKHRRRSARLTYSFGNIQNRFFIHEFPITN
ncbi:hypothetical protein [Pseudomonas oryzihabitans]|uniref:hypothetical protein n=1 Tax=Pseudomonas oryzihabitans TaxID=47885 RepID=UPI000B28DBD7|nr:hypothetical protein [Pseudomonas oryzihabitans]